MKWNFRLITTGLVTIFFARSLSAGVYKWVDDNGVTQFGDNPVGKKHEKIMETTPDAAGKSKTKSNSHPIEKKIIGQWKGILTISESRKTDFFQIKIYPNDTFKLGGKNVQFSYIHDNNGKPSSSLTNVFRGIWSIKGNKVNFKIKFLDAYYNKYNQYSYATIVRQEYKKEGGEEIDLLFDNGDRFVAKRSYNDGLQPRY